VPSPPQLLTDDPSTTSQRIQSQLVEPLTALKARAQAEQPQSEAVAAVHADGLCSCGSSTLSSRSYGRMADGLLGEGPRNGVGIAGGIQQVTSAVRPLDSQNVEPARRREVTVTDDAGP
jgi:hypothetical protein